MNVRCTFFFFTFSELQIRLCIKFEILFFILWQSQKWFSLKNKWPHKKSSKFYRQCNVFACKNFFPKNPLLKVGCILSLKEYGILGMFWLAYNLLASQVGLCHMEFKSLLVQLNLCRCCTSYLSKIEGELLIFVLIMLSVWLLWSIGSVIFTLSHNSVPKSMEYFSEQYHRWSKTSY